MEGPARPSKDQAQRYCEPAAASAAAKTEQRFYLAFGQVWCSNEREEALRLQVSTNEHSPAKFRVNGVVQNMPEFQKAFSCKAGQPMAKANVCRVW